MSERDIHLFTSESVTEGHPDKVADQISDGVLDACLRDDPGSRVACETLVNTGLVVISGEITTKTYVDFPSIVRNTIKEIGGIVTTGPYIAGAPLAIVVAVDKTRFAFSDVSRAIQSMVLTAWADGVGSNWAGGPGHLDGLKPLLGIPDELDVVAVLPPDEAAPSALTRRRSLRAAR